MKEVKPIIPIVYENNKPMTGIIDMARIHNESKLVKKAVAEALSARDKEWEEKIEKFFITPEWDYSEREIRINIDDWNKLLSQMKEGK